MLEQRDQAPKRGSREHCLRAHAWYCQLMELPGLSFDLYASLWHHALTHYESEQIAAAARYVRVKILRDNCDRGAALPRNFLRPDKLESWIALSTPKQKPSADQQALAEEFVRSMKRAGRIEEPKAETTIQSESEAPEIPPEELEEIVRRRREILRNEFPDLAPPEGP